MLPYELYIEISYYVKDKNLVCFYQALNFSIRDELISRVWNIFSFDRNRTNIDFITQHYFLTNDSYHDYCRVLTDLGYYNERSHYNVDLYDILTYKAKQKDFEYLRSYSEISDPFTESYIIDDFEGVIAEELLVLGYTEEEIDELADIKNINEETKLIVLGRKGSKQEIEKIINNSNWKFIQSGLVISHRLDLLSEFAPRFNINYNITQHIFVTDNLEKFKLIPRSEHDIYGAICSKALKILEYLLIDHTVTIKEILYALKSDNLIILNILMTHYPGSNRKEILEMFVKTPHNCILNLYTYKFLFSELEANIFQIEEIFIHLDVNVLKYLILDRGYKVNSLPFIALPDKDRYFQARYYENLSFLNTLEY